MQIIELKRTVVLFAATAIVAGCTTFEDFMAPASEAPVPQAVELPPPEERPREAPLSSNHFVLESPEQTVIGEPQIVFTTEENTFSDLARQYGLGYDELVEANPDVDPWLPGEGTLVVLPTQYVLPNVPREGIVLNIASKRLFYFPPVEADQPQAVMTYPIGIGRVGWQTPLGTSSVISKARDPSWYVPASVRSEHEELGDPLPAVVPPGPDNPLGRHVLKLDIPGYLIHGTNQPYGVGMRVSHGCVRLYPENIELLYDLIELGESVTIINEPFLAGTQDGQIYFESHAPLEDDDVMVEQRLVDILERIELLASEQAIDFDLGLMRDTAKTQLGVPVILSGGPGEALVARARVVENTVEPDPSLPSLAEVRAILDEPLEDDEAEDSESSADIAVAND
jgi:L,D-transpeptidase ErfK/SrfK